MSEKDNENEEKLLLDPLGKTVENIQVNNPQLSDAERL